MGRCSRPATASRCGALPKHAFPTSMNNSACRNEFKERLFVLNNTLLHPDSLTALGYGAMFAPGDRITMRRFAETRLPHVNEQLGLGLYSCRSEERRVGKECRS